MVTSERTLKQPVGRGGLPLIGNMADFARGPLDFVKRLQEDYGDVAAFSLMGKKMILLSDPERIERILLETGKRYRKFNPSHALGTVLGNGLVTSEGDFWKRQHKLVAPAFHHQYIKQYADLIVAYAQDAVKTWKGSSTRDIHEEMMLLTQRIIMKALFDVDMLSSATSAGEAFNAMMHGLGTQMKGIDAILPDFIPTPSRTQMAEGVAYINSLLIDIIEKRQTDSSARQDLLTVLMEARDADDQPMSQQQMLDEIRTLYLAGHETTAATLSWAWLLLSRNPDAYTKIEAEVDEVLQGRAPTADDIPRLPYTNAVIKESLRCYPVAWVFQRMTTEDEEINGYAIPKDTMIWISPWVIHHDARWYPEPEAFKPERWLKDKAEQPPREAYIPFGGGPRICLGNGFAMMEGALVMATIVQQYRVAVLPTHPVEIEMTGTIRPKHGLQASLTPRNR